MTSPRVILSGGGTGGHIFPAVSIAQEIQRRFPDAEFLFIGALGKMEMEKVPQAGFKIEGLEIAGFDRGNLFSNIKLPLKVLKSYNKAKSIIKNFRPDFVIGTGGFASGPALYAASKMGIPTFVQEQNSLPGVTNKILSKRAKVVFTAYPNMEQFFPKTEVKYLGNPIRQSIIDGKLDTAVAKEKLGIPADQLTILSVGGSLGSRTLNNGWKDNLDKLKDKGYQLIWQTGKTEYAQIIESLGESGASNTQHPTSIQINEFIKDMETAYSAADVIVSRAGAIAISELAVVDKPILLVPFPFAAEDHQTKNAQSLVDKKAALMVKDSEMKEKFWDTLTQMTDNENLRHEMAQNLKALGKPEATKHIVDEILNKTRFNK